MGKIILLNGPPSSGKDTAAKAIRGWYDQERGHRRCMLDRMSMPIKRAFAGYVNQPCSSDGVVENYEYRKDEPLPELAGKSFRQWQIDFSESFIKPLYGAEAFPQLLAARIRRRFEKNIADLIVVPDCGFKVEVDVIYQQFDPRDILLIRCFRQGFIFQGDSRHYVRAPAGCAVFGPINSLLAEYEGQVIAGVSCWLETPERMPREE